MRNRSYETQPPRPAEGPAHEAFKFIAPVWFLEAACDDSNADFFPDRGQDVKEAKAICQECPVKEECLQMALENRNTYGIWGGTTVLERKRIKRAKRAS